MLKKQKKKPLRSMPNNAGGFVNDENNKLSFVWAATLNEAGVEIHIIDVDGRWRRFTIESVATSPDERSDPNG